MTKQEFITTLRQKLSGLPTQELEDRLNFYSEIIDDKIEEGKTEEDAVAEIGEVGKIATQIISETSLFSIVKENVRPTKKSSPLQTALLVVGSPLWFTLAVAFCAIVFALYVVLWCLVVVVWAIFIAFAVACPMGIIISTSFNFSGNPYTSVALIGISIILGGLAILMFFASKKATTAILAFSKKMLLGIKNYFIKRRATHNEQV